MKSAVLDVNVAVTSLGIIAEIEEKLISPKIGGAYGIGLEDVRWVRGLFLTQAKVVTVRRHEVLQVTGDPEDDYVLATTRAGAADFLVTGDHKLLAIREYEQATIVSPREFLDGLQEAL